MTEDDDLKEERNVKLIRWVERAVNDAHSQPS